MSVEAFNWAWTTRVGNSQSKTLLMGLGGYAHRNGRHAFPARKTLAEYGECSVKTVDRVLSALVDEGFIRRGDQSLVENVRADRRPVVYDLAMTEETRAEWKAERRVADGRGDNLSPRGDDPELDDTDTDELSRGDNLSPRPRSGVSPRDEATGRHLNDPRGDTAVTPERSTNPNTPQPPSAATGVSDGCPTHGFDVHPSCRGCGTTLRSAEALAAAETERRRQETIARRRADNARAVQAEYAATGKAAAAEVRAAAVAEARRLLDQSAPTRRRLPGSTGVGRRPRPATLEPAGAGTTEVDTP